VFYNVERDVLIGGGRDVKHINNLSINVSTCISMDARGTPGEGPQNNVTLFSRLLEIPYQQPPWAQQYPELVTILTDDTRPGFGPHAPKGTTISNNIMVGCKRVKSITSNAWYYVNQTYVGNYVHSNLTTGLANFVDPSNLNFKLKIDAAILQANGTQNFVPIPFEKIGLLGSIGPDAPSPAPVGSNPSGSGGTTGPNSTSDASSPIDRPTIFAVLSCIFIAFHLMTL
jgi:hypothetical protein